MTAPLRLVIFDVDGTLVDSQTHILGAMRNAFDQAQHPVPTAAEILGIVGLSLPEAMFKLAPHLDLATRELLVEGYKQTYMSTRDHAGEQTTSPLYPGVRDVLDHLAGRPDVVLGVATGKSRRGLDRLMETHDLAHFFVTQQVADDHPSKPHPSMVQAALAAAGVGAEHAVMIGDTSYDMEMGTAAGVPTIGVTWGYHAPDVLNGAGAGQLIHAAHDLPAALLALWGKI